MCAFFGSYYVENICETSLIFAYRYDSELFRRTLQALVSLRPSWRERMSEISCFGVAYLKRYCNVIELYSQCRRITDRQWWIRQYLWSKLDKNLLVTIILHFPVTNPSVRRRSSRCVWSGLSHIDVRMNRSKTPEAAPNKHHVTRLETHNIRPPKPAGHHKAYTCSWFTCVV
jgi:hypothetical protein